MKACVLVSGGIDSAALLTESLRRFSSVTPVYVRQNLFWEKAELFWLRSFLKAIRSEKLKPLRILELPMDDVYGRHWSTTGKKIPGAASKDSAVYLAGRNITLLSKAAAFASLNGITVIRIGILKGNPFADSSVVFFKKMSESLSIGLNRAIRIEAPFRKLRKENVIAQYRNLPLHLTFSCLKPIKKNHCGSCNKCTERKRGFLAAGLLIKTLYSQSGLSPESLFGT